jgi:splicing factor 45
MVGPGEVDEDLEPETAEECGKYGKVTKCVIFEVSGYFLVMFAIK